MKISSCTFLLLALAPLTLSADSLTLANDEWPPFILDGDQQGKSERLVCQALERAGHSCTVNVDDWDAVLVKSRSGDVDGIAAAWRSPEREAYLLFSEPYLTNRIVPVVSNRFDGSIKDLGDLKGLRVAFVQEYAYGAELEASKGQFQAISVKSAAAALEKVRSQAADVALVDELVARTRLDGPDGQGLTALSTVLALRSLHFAVSRANPNAQQILDGFHQAYQAMLFDGSVNEILEVDWLATDFGQPGNVSVVMRSGVSLDDLDNPNSTGGMYALDESEYEWMQKRSVEDSRVKYQVEGKSYSNLNTALSSAFGKDAVCKHNDYSSTFDCTDLFKR